VHKKKKKAVSATSAVLKIGENTTQLQNLVVWIGSEIWETHNEIEIFLGWIFNLLCQHFQSLSLSIWHHLCIAVITWDITGLY